MTLDPTKVQAGQKGGLMAGRKRAAHLTDTEYDVMRELKQQVKAYREGTHGGQRAVAIWLRALADRLDGKP